MSRYTPTSDADRESMLRAIGVGSIDELFYDIPKSVRQVEAIDIPDGLPEHEVIGRIGELAKKNTHADEEVTFVGAGMYDHYVPACVGAITARSEFLTSYTPYQPEISQGGLQAIFEFQTAISELVGLPVANASLYDGPTSAVEAAYMAKNETERKNLVVSRGLHPHTRELLRTYSRGLGTEVIEVSLERGVTSDSDLAGLVDDETAAVFLQQPNFLGSVEDLDRLSEIIKSTGALSVCICDPLTLGVLAPPGKFDVDVACGDGQPLGNSLSFGGPSFGFLAASDAHMRRMPGRISGETVDVDGRRGFVLTLQTREQHIRRERATSNICSNQALNALAGIVYLSWLGRRGIVEMGDLILQRTAYARDLLGKVDGVELLHEAPVVREFAVRLDAPVEAVIDRCHDEGIAAGHPLGRTYPEYGDGLLIAITEKRSRGQIDRLAEVLGRVVADERKAAEAVEA